MNTVPKEPYDLAVACVKAASGVSDDDAREALKRAGVECEDEKLELMPPAPTPPVLK